MVKPFVIYIVDFTYTQQGLQSEIAPSAIGGIATYARKIHGDDIQCYVFKQPEKFSKAFEDRKPDLIGFSNYSWNARLSWAFARRIKKSYPEITIVYGGPHYPLPRDEQEAYLLEHDEMDYFVIKEGEVGFASLVGHLKERRGTYPTELIESVHWLERETGRFSLAPPSERLKDLDDIPSPYLNGDMDEFIDDGFMPIIQTNRGCPFSCTFCVEGTLYYNKVRNKGHERIYSELDYIGNKMAPRVAEGKRADLFIADSNFGMYNGDLEICDKIAECQDNYNWPQHVSVATGKNQKHRIIEAARRLRGAMRLSGSVQSLDGDVLANIKRKNVSADDIMQVAIEGGKAGALTYSEVILGLPGDTVEKFKNTVSRLLDAGFNKVEVYTLMLLPGSELDDAETREKFGLVTKYRAIPRCFGIFDIAGERFAEGEIEEVVVETNTMSFEEYVECRVYSLLIVLINNDGYFALARKLLNDNGIGMFEVIEHIYDRQSTIPEKLKIIIDSFRAETRSELWDNQDDLAHALNSPEQVKHYIDGEVGNNVLYRHKSMAIIQAFKEIGAIMGDAVETLLTRKLGNLNPHQKQFVRELMVWCTSYAIDVLDGAAEPPVHDFHFDLEAIIEKNQFGSITSAGEARTIRFIQDEGQQTMAQWYLNTYGTELTGLTRLLTRVNLKRLLRKPEELNMHQAALVD
ncbi:B12-binding domain-containing radical SAM protein [Thalassospira povalilytica]|uniref:B12-binding domain-containing radical SAM protein n=1 Tax=Thalassospira povalilytica TaxID=732237 RepID=UPI001D1940A7|nr:cobalamin-dependent protein [Thalassospira povalilytica]MCC4241916.1 cobalamin-dependent protein [Thalassospira povalilytica]